MLNLHRLAPGAESYYLDQVVSGIEDYYSEEGEAPGHWLASSYQLDLTGLVQPEDLRAVLTGIDPHTGEHLHREEPEGARLGSDVPCAEVRVDPLGSRRC